MNLIIAFAVGAVAGIAAVLLWQARTVRAKKETLIEWQKREKAADLESILGIMETQSPLTNSHIEQLLGILESTATRYLDELEKEGKVKQVGVAGRYVHYEKVR